MSFSAGENEAFQAGLRLVSVGWVRVGLGSVGCHRRTSATAEAAAVQKQMNPLGNPSCYG